MDFIPLKKNLGTTTQQVNNRETVKTKEENCKYIIVIGFMALDNVFFFSFVSVDYLYYITN